MPDVNTPIYLFIEPEVGGSDDTWGDKLNTNWAKIDTLLGQAFSGGNGSSVGTLKPGVLPSDDSFPYVKKAGDTMTGILVMSNASQAGVSMYNTGAAAGLKRWRAVGGTGGTYNIIPYADDNITQLNGAIQVTRDADGVVDMLFSGGSGYTSSAPPAPGSVMNRARGDNRYLQLSGGTLSGKLTVTAGGVEVTGGLIGHTGLTIDGTANFNDTVNNKSGLSVWAPSAAGNATIYLRNSAGNEIGLFWSNSATAETRLRSYATPGGTYKELILNGSTGAVTTQGPLSVTGNIDSSGNVTASGNLFGSNAYLDNAGSNVNLQLRQNGNNRAVLYWSNSDSTLRLGIYNAAADAIVGSIVWDRAGQIYAGQGGEFINLNASNLNSGTVPQARLTAAVVAGAYSAIGAGNVGTYAFASHSSGSIGFNATVAASTLTPCNASGATGSAISAGTWRCMGWCGSPDPDDRATLWLRVS